MTRKIPMSGDAYDKMRVGASQGRMIQRKNREAVLTFTRPPKAGETVTIGNKIATFKRVEQGGRSLKAVASYFGGEITERQKRAHERKLLAVMRAAESDCMSGNWGMLQHHYRTFVNYAGKQRPPFVTGHEKVDQRLLAAVGGAGEMGEVCGTIKKLMFRVKLDKRRLSGEWREKLTSEMGDLLWYFFLVCIAFNINFNDIMRGNMKKLVQRGR